MKEEYRRWLGPCLTERGYDALVQGAFKQAWRTHLEELLLGKLDADNIDRWVQFHGLENLETALSAGRGVVWIYPHAGPVMLMLSGLAHKGFQYTQYAARGLAPEEVAKDHPELLAANRWRSAVREARESNEDQLPAEFLTLDTPVRALHRRLADNRIVGLAFDGRIGTGWWPAPFLNRTALLSSGPWKLAVSTGAMVVPAFCHSPCDGPATVEIGAPLEPGNDWQPLALTVLQQQETWLRRHPEEYGFWMLHTRDRSAIDDHPMFIDTAPDDRYRRWMPDE
jgi:lauroyl/myristoyl acyltransferase